MKLDQRLQCAAWVLSTVVTIVAFVAWGQGLSWRLSGVSTYRIFPLFGLLAFSLMWTHYIASAARQYLKIDKYVLKKYFEITSLVVLFCIILHPGLLVWQLWRDGLGLPPGSYLNNFVSKSNEWAALIATLSLLIFLTYELHRWFSKRKWWKVVQYASDFAMVLIFIHGLKLGKQLHSGWFRVIWWGYGVSLVATLVFIRSIKSKSTGDKET